MTKNELIIKQSLPLHHKIILTKQRIKEWYEAWQGNVYVSFSGGKDSTVLLYLVRSMYPDVPAVFCNTGLEYPEIINFVKQTDNVIWLKPKRTFKEVIEKYGYPVISKEQAQYINQYRNSKSEKLKNIRLNGGQKFCGKISAQWLKLINAPFKISDKCCDYLKKQPFKKYEHESDKKMYMGILCHESDLRVYEYIKNGGCNAFNLKRPVSNPLSIWLETDIWEYIKQNNIQYSKIYDMGYKRTGCMFCMFGVHLGKEPNRFQKMYITHPKLWNYCINKLNLKQILDYIKVPYLPSGQLSLLEDIKAEINE